MELNTMTAAHRARLERLCAGLEHAGLDGALISRPQHFFYFTGCLPGKDPHFLLVRGDRAAAVAPAPLAGVTTYPYSAYDIQRGWSAPDNAAAALDEALAGVPPLRRVGIEAAHLGVLFAARLEAKGGETVDIQDLLWETRKIRDAGEIAQIERNVGANDRIFAQFRTALRPGVSEYELWSLAQRALCEANGGPAVLEADLGVGERGSRPDAKPGPFAFAAGDVVFLDLYSATRGYYADTTRTFTPAGANPRQREVHAVLCAALAAGEEQLRAGTRACDIDRAVRGVIERAGYGDNFGHHSGHAYNFFQQDKPYFIPAETKPIEAGMVVTLEPGIYLPGWGGMRLERNYLVGETGARVLDRYPLDLEG